MTLTFDLLTSKSNQFIFVLNCIEIVNFVKFSRAISNISCSKLLAYDREDIDKRTTRKQHAFGR